MEAPKESTCGYSLHFLRACSWARAVADQRALARLADIWGESGAGARMLKPHWVRDVIADCSRSGVAPFHKQWGSYDNNPLVVEKGMTAREARAIDAEGKGGGLVDGKLVREFPESELKVPKGIWRAARKRIVPGVYVCGRGSAMRVEVTDHNMRKPAPVVYPSGQRLTGVRLEAVALAATGALRELPRTPDRLASASNQPSPIAIAHNAYC